MYNFQGNQKLEIDNLKLGYQFEQRLYQREYDSVKMMLAQSEKEKQQATQKYNLLNQKYQEKKIIDILDEQSLQSQIKNDGTRLFKAAKYAILGLERKQDEVELPNKTEKVTDKSLTSDPKIQTFQAQDSQINAQFSEDEQSKIYQSKDDRNYSQSLINFMNELDYERAIYTTQERLPDYDQIPSKQIKSQGQSATVSFMQKNQPKHKISTESKIQQLDDNAYFHFTDDTSRTEQKINIDQQIETLLDDIQGIVARTSKQPEQTLITHKLKLQNEKPQKVNPVQQIPNFHPVNLAFNQTKQEQQSTKRVADNSKQIDNLDQLILDLCN
ncbi:unnamed protein product (macronuclear) [Paramecium tetraurelia]|uniref:Uncharacterized protein n=1 Tax=Paramecium tetraurelia TaxID=5888 RepID=A0DKZ1_PARTE|nr:uncharacterized protein GSPATT00018025001 [Paramecium tetraurelia]CAK83708.1 unnamed protein product [Paramecium tetraurelia]|eukprot:XP_001451105.1 hypothetical protein (macronuclear) [Paramecium tetraurelia strain d4-2]